MKHLLSIIAVLFSTALYAQDIDLAGAVHLGNTTSPSPGAIRWTGLDFEGYNGSAWLSLTGEVPAQYGIVTDIDGHDYRTVIIGNQTWMADNLKTKRYNDEVSIGSALNEDGWSFATAFNLPVYTRIQDTDEWTSVFGLLYNWHAIDPVKNGDRNICPSGWHIPTLGEWNTLRTAVGGIYGASAIKTRGSSPNQTGPWLHDFNGSMTNTSGFDAMPTGRRDPDGPFENLRQKVFFWTATTSGADNARAVRLNVGDNVFSAETLESRDTGVAIRCVKDD